jgi:hypothetical protein
VWSSWSTASCTTRGRKPLKRSREVVNSSTRLSIWGSGSFVKAKSFGQTPRLARSSDVRMHTPVRSCDASKDMLVLLRTISGSPV